MVAKILPIGMALSVVLAALAPARKVLVSGDHHATSLAMQITTNACQDKRVLYICGDNRFDPYAITRLAKSMGLTPDDALSSIHIARAFTAYQLVELVAELAPDVSNDFIVISGLCSSFFDEDVPYVDAARLFYRVLWRVVELAHNGNAMLLIQGRTITSARRAYFLTDLCRASDVVLNLSGEHSFTLERRSRAALPGLAALDKVLLKNDYNS